MPAASAFTLEGTSETVDTVAISGMDVILTLSAPVSSTDVVTVTYMPGTNPVQDEAGNAAAALTDLSVNNITPPVPTGVMASPAAPDALEVSWTEPDLLGGTGGYDVQYRIDGGSNWLPDPAQLVAAGTAGDPAMHTFNMPPLAAGMYHARVRSRGVSATSAWVETSSAVRVGDLELPAPTLPDYTVNVAIDPAVTLPAATGGTPTISYTLTGPNGADLSEVPGLMFDATNRQLSGTPTTAGITTLTYTATDSATPTPATVTQTFTITINTVLTLPAQDNLAYTVNTAIAPVTLPQATGGVGTISYALTGTLPAGLAFTRPRTPASCPARRPRRAARLR